MSGLDTPIGLLSRIDNLTKGTGIELIGISRLLKQLDAGSVDGLEQWSLLFQRLYRYDDLLSLEFCSAVADGKMDVAHLMVEAKKHEAQSIAYRLAGLAVDAAIPDNDKGIPGPVAEDELAAMAGCLLALYWAFASLTEREALLKEVFSDCDTDDLTRNTLMNAPPIAVIEPMSDASGALEDMASEVEFDSSIFARPVYPPLHPATQYDKIPSDEQVDQVNKLP